MKLKNRTTLSLLMAVIMVLTMIPFHAFEVRAAATPTLDFGNPVRVTETTYQLPNAAFGSTDVVHTNGGYFTVAVNNGSIAVGNHSSGITELTDGIKISDKVADKSTDTNRVFNFSSDTTYEDIQAAIRNMKFTQDPGQTQRVTVNVMPGVPLADGKTSVRTYNGRHFVYVARQSTMTFKDAVTTAKDNKGHLVEPTPDNPEEMLAIANMFREFENPFKDSWNFLSFIGASKSTEKTDWRVTPFGSDWTKYVSNGQPTNLENSKEYVKNGTFVHLTLLLDTTNNKLGYLAVDNTHGGTSQHKDPGVIVEYNSDVISDIIVATKDIELPVMGGSVTIDGIAKAGQTLMANITGIMYTPNTTGNVPTSQWYRNGVAIPNATGSSYTLTADDIGAAITLTVTADGTHAVGSVTSAATTAVTKSDGPAAPSAPVASGVTSTSIILQAVSGQEYSMDGGLTWQDSPTFSGLTPNTDYTFVTRVKATATQMASAVSQATTIRTSAEESAVDKTQLQAAVDKINRENLQATDYTPASWQTLQDALKNAQNVLGDPNASQTQINDVLQKLTEARAGLKTDKTELQNTVKEVEAFINGGNYNRNNYTPESVQIFEDALTRARDVLGNPNATQQEINQANKALKEAYKNLVTKDAILKSLELKVFDSRGGKEIQLEPPFNGHKYLNYSATVTESVYGVALTLEELHPESEVTGTFNGNPVDRWDDLRLKPGSNEIKVTVNFQGKTNTYTVVIYKTDKTKLQELVDKVNGEKNSGTLKQEYYTPESWSRLQDKLTAAEAVLKNPNATQAEVDAALAALNDARNRLASANAGLASLNVGDANGNPIALTPAFDGRQLNYKAVVSNGVSTVGINPQALQPGSKVAVTLNGNPVNASDWNKLPLKEGLNTILVEVTGPDGKQTTYTMEIVRTTNKLVSLTPSSGSLSPAFDSDKEAYTMTVSNDVYQLQWTPVALDPGAKIEIGINGGAFSQVASGATSAALPLNFGANTVTVKVTDRDGHIKEYTITVIRVSSGGGRRPSGGGGTGSSSGDIITTVNDNKSPFATETTEQSGDRKVTTVKIDAGKLTDILSKGGAQNLAIRVPGDGDIKVEGLTAALVKQLKDTGSSLEIGNLLAIYPIPSSQLDLGAIAKQWNNAALSDIAVNINIRRSEKALIDNARSRATAGGYELLVNPVDLDLTFSHGGQTVRAEQLNGYAARYIALPEGIDPKRITTGVIVIPDGSVHHVPTVVTKISDRYFAKIQDLRSHGSYSVIWNPQDFNDVKSHWAHTTVNNIAARLILAGTGDKVFSPDRNINRSEFAVMAATGMGLMSQETAQNAFHDVTSAAWYRNGVSIASEFGIVEGYEDGTFRGERQITREQGIAMIARAYNLIRPQSAAMSQTEIASALSAYGDAAELSDWARETVARMIRAGIIEGSAGQSLKPQDSMTRAEAAAMIERMLKTTDFIDK